MRGSEGSLLTLSFINQPEKTNYIITDLLYQAPGCLLEILAGGGVGGFLNFCLSLFGPGAKLWSLST